jgi:hypothetical protein
LLARLRLSFLNLFLGNPHFAEVVLDYNMNCTECGKKIPKIRLKALPDTTTCVRCSQEEAHMGLTVWDKSTSELVIVDSSEAERFKELEKYDGRMARL